MSRASQPGNDGVSGPVLAAGAVRDKQVPLFIGRQGNATCSDRKYIHVQQRNNIRISQDIHVNFYVEFVPLHCMWPWDTDSSGLNLIRSV